MDLLRPHKEIDRPLGTSRPPPKPRRKGPGLRALALAVLALAMLGASGAIALRERPWRTPEIAVASTPEIVQPEPEAEVGSAELPAPARVQTAPGGPAIIKVNPGNDAEAPDQKSVMVIRDPSGVGQDTRVAHLPDRALIETSETGPLPVRGADGRRPMDVYARKWSGARGARVAIVVGGLGLSQTGTKDAIDRLPPEVTLAFAPQGNSLDRWMQAARREGHEILIQTPLEPFDYPSVDPGRNTLTVEASPQENLSRLRWTLSRTTNYTGIMNYMGGRFVADQPGMGTLMDELGKRGLLYLDDGSTARSVAAEQALAHRVPFAAADSTIDAARDRAAILKKLDELEATARAKGFALGTGTAFSETVAAVASWVAEAKKRGIEIVPVSALVSDPEKS